MDISDFDRSIFEKASSVSGREGHTVRSSVRHLERAWKLADEMPEIAVFLAITAQEEAATALLLALKKRKYEGSQRLSIRNHKHKNGVYPLIRLIGSAFLENKLGVTIQLSFVSNGKRDILRCSVPIGMKGDQEVHIFPDPPLHIFSLESEGVAKDYHAAIINAASNAGIESVLERIEELANERNQMLYASDSDIPTAKDALSRVNELTRAVVRTLLIYLLIEPHKQRQNLVQEALNAYIKVLDHVPPNLE